MANAARLGPPTTRCQPRTVSGFTISSGLRQSLNHRTCQNASSKAAYAGAAVPIVAGADKNFAVSSAFGLKIAAMAKISNRNSYVPTGEKVVGRIERETR